MQFSESWLKHPDKGDMKRGKRHEFILSIVMFLSIRFFDKQVFYGLLDDSFIDPLSDLVCIDVGSPLLETINCHL